MKIGIDGRAAKWYRGTGIGTYTYQLINNLSIVDSSNQYLILLPQNTDLVLKDNFTIECLKESSNNHFWDDVKTPNLLKNNKMDLYHVPQNGVGLSEITTYLNDNNIKTPSSLKRKNPNSKAKYNPMWTISSVKKILKNQMYVGDMVQSVQTKVSYKSKKKKSLPKSNWDIVKNTHEPLVDRFIFESVQNNIKRTTKTTINKREKRLFENLLYCKECGNTLTISYRKNHDYWTINCNRYSRDPKRRMCEPHFSPYEKLEEALLEVIRNTCKKYLNKLDVSEISKSINKKDNSEVNNNINDLRKQEKALISKLDMLYQDKFNDIVSEEMYLRISRETENSLVRIREKIQSLQDAKNDKKVNKNDLKNYEDKIRELIDIDNPSRELIGALIDKIIIDKDRNIEIIYKFSVLNA